MHTCGLPLPVQRPRDTLTARRVRHGVELTLICQPGPSPGIKTHSSPAAFPATLSLPFPPRSSPSCTAPPGHTSGRTELYLLPAGPFFAQNRYDASSGKNVAARLASSYSLDASATLSPRPSDPFVDPWTMTLVKRPAFASDFVTQRP